MMRINKCSVLLTLCPLSSTETREQLMAQKVTILESLLLSNGGQV